MCITPLWTAGAFSIKVLGGTIAEGRDSKPQSPADLEDVIITLGKCCHDRNQQWHISGGLWSHSHSQLRSASEELLA